MRGYHIHISLQPKIEPSSSQSISEDFIPSSFFDPFPSQKPRPTLRKNATFNPSKKDYRLGPIRVDWADYQGMSKQGASNVGKGRDTGRGPVVASFVAQNSIFKTGSTNLPDGIVHIYREGPTKNKNEEEIALSSSVAPLASSHGVTLGVLAVPPWMTPSDFLAFVAPAADSIAHLRIIRDCVPNRSMVIIDFRKAEDAGEFIEAYNGKPFNSMEPETCHVVHILSVKVDTEDTFSQTWSTGSSVYELPTCPVCLERMDSAVTGLITVPCSHTFHCMCLSKWGDSRCPVCRYSQTLLSSHPSVSSSTSSVPIPFANPNSTSLSTCSSCSSTTNLWICLICGNIGCGRYGRAHAHAHYDSTTHLYALELETQRVWDYAGDGYVHRLIQNKADGKLVELPSASSTMGMSPRDGGVGPGPADALTAEKVEAIGIEYSYLLTSQLDSQRSYYEEQMSDMKSEINTLKGMVESLSRQVTIERAEAKEMEESRRRELDEQAIRLQREKVKAECRADKMSELARKFEKDLREERAVSEGLMSNLKKIKEKSDLVEQERRDWAGKMRDLEDQLRDVMFFLEAKTKIENGGGVEAEAAGGSIEIGLPPSSKKKKSRKG